MKRVFLLTCCCIIFSAVCSEGDSPPKEKSPQSPAAHSLRPTLIQYAWKAYGPSAMQYLLPHIEKSGIDLAMYGSRFFIQWGFELGVHKHLAQYFLAGKLCLHSVAGVGVIYGASIFPAWLTQKIKPVLETTLKSLDSASVVSISTSAAKAAKNYLPTVSKWCGIALGCAGIGLLAYMAYQGIKKYQRDSVKEKNYFKLQSAEELTTEEKELPEFLSDCAASIKNGDISGILAQNRGIILIEGTADTATKLQLVAQFARKINTKLPVCTVSYDMLQSRIEQGGEKAEDFAKKTIMFTALRRFAYDTPCSMICFTDSEKWLGFNGLTQHVTHIFAPEEPQTRPEIRRKKLHHDVVDDIKDDIKSTFQDRCDSEIARKPMLFVFIESNEGRGKLADQLHGQYKNLFKINCNADNATSCKNPPVKIFRTTTTIQLLSQEKLRIETIYDGGLNEWPGEHPEAIWAIAHKLKDPKKYARLTTDHLLFYGNPGIGKTQLIRALAGTVGAPLVTIDTSDPIILDHFEEIFSDIIEYAKNQARRPLIVLMDDINLDIFAPEKPLCQKLKTILAGINGRLENLVVIATTNSRLTEKNKTLVRSGRFRAIELSLPTPKIRTQILEYYLKKLAPNSSIQEGTVTELVGRTEGWTPADLSRIIEQGINKATLKKEELSDKYLIEGYEEASENRSVLSTSQKKQHLIDSKNGEAGPSGSDDTSESSESIETVRSTEDDQTPDTTEHQTPRSLSPA